MREHINSGQIGSVLRFVKRMGILVGVTLALDVVASCVFLLYRGEWDLLGFIELFIALLLLEGCVIGAAGGGLAFFGYVEYWSIVAMIAGVLLIFLGLLVSFVTSV